MKILLSIAVLATLFTGQAQAYDPNTSPYQLEVTRDGVTSTLVAYTTWSGEWPGPVINVNKDMTVQAYSSVRKLDNLVSCSIEKGVYHPWNQQANSAVNYYSLAGVTEYRVTVSHVNEEMDKAVWDPEKEEFGYSLEVGDVITNVVYGGEGWCGGTHIDDNKTDAEGNKVKTDVSFFCDLDPAKSEVIQENWDTPTEQWIYLQCKEGNKAFIKDSTIMSLPNVSQGSFDGYGQVAPIQ